MTQIEGPIIPRFHRFSQVRIRPLSRSQMKRLIFVQSPWLHSLTHRFSEGRLVTLLAKLVASLTLKFHGGRYPHRILSGPSLRSIFLLFSSYAKFLPSSPVCQSKNHSSSFHYRKVLSFSVLSQNSFTFWSPPFSILS